MFKSLTTALVVMTACALTGPAAIAQTRTDTGANRSQAQTERPMQGRQMSQQGASVPFMVGHAYKEALHYHESVAMGMEDMARNHLENVRIMLGHIDMDRDITDQRLRNELTQLRDRVGGLRGGVSLDHSRDLVNRFTNVIAAMPAPQGGGGGQSGVTPMVLLPAELVAKATDSVADAQIDASQRNFAGAKIHAQHAVAALDAAVQSAKLHQMRQPTIQEIQGLRSRAQQLQNAIGQSSPQAVKDAGQLVQRLGQALPTLTASQGGGAGVGQPKDKRPAGR